MPTTITYIKDFFFNFQKLAYLFRFLTLTIELVKYTKDRVLVNDANHSNL